MHILLAAAISVLKILYAPIRLLPATDTITFISRQANTPNTDFIMLSEELKKQRPGLKTVFLCRKIGDTLPRKIAYLFHMLRQLYWISRSKALILDSYCIAASVLHHKKDLVIFQIWHALGALKKFGYSILDRQEGSSRELAEVLCMHKNYDYVFTSSSLAAPHFAEAFHVPAEKMVVNPLPRVDRLLNQKWQEETRRRIFEACPELQTKPILLYAPTFRKNRDNMRPFQQIASMADSSRYNLILAPHPNIEEQIKKMEHAIVLPQFSTIELAAAADAVITDYSALIYELSLLNKPIYYWIYDYDQYETERSFYTNFLTEAPGVKSKSLTEILQAIDSSESAPADDLDFAEKYVQVRGNCTQSMADFILSHLRSFN